jgi:hypothetical protein
VWWQPVELGFDEEGHLGVVGNGSVHLCPEPHNISEDHDLLSIPHEKGLGAEASALIVNLRWRKLVVVCPWLLRPQILRCLLLLALMRVGVCKESVALSVMVDGELEEVHPLLQEVDVSKVLNMQYKLVYRSE